MVLFSYVARARLKSKNCYESSESSFNVRIQVNYTVAT